MSFTLGIRDGDFDFNVYGKPEFIEGQDKASQDLAEAVLSTYDSGRDYGCRATPGNVPSIAAKPFMSMELTLAVERLQSLQNADVASTATERISAITSLQVTQNRSDPTTLSYNLAASTEAGRSVSTSSTVRSRRMTFGHLS
jgi:hypothetical protein